jgi:pyrimidine deaminase RibD-like protein
METARVQRIDVDSATLYVTLEPCTYRSLGKISCAERIVASSIRRVCFGMLDPNPRNRGAGELLLRRGGLVVERYPHDFIRLIESDNADFIRLHETIGKEMMEKAEVQFAHTT